ncbi:microcystin-dependent protein [Serratia sp. BIGb0234]|uniref:tail fiber protein n=1 Tax=Serratia sp. BIGb0234 TaxID=2940614 RepID=UPI0021679297|nr:tail fiber protein [Serratia sp. BIGb0234]MCS4320698.1 microcystin-dependent protein [Serratia sp. BIGb0234]
MTDKTPKNEVETSVNTPTTLTGTTDTARDSVPKSRVLPQVAALKARFKAGSIPLQTDFADLIDLANMGRQAVGGSEGQTGPANGFTLSSMGRLELKPNAAKGIFVDNNGVAVMVDESKGMQASNAGIGVKLYPNLGLEHNNQGIWVKVDNKGLTVDGNGVAIKVDANKGVQVSSSGISVKVGSGVAVNSGGVSVKLAKGSYTNGGAGQGTDGATTGNAGGLALSPNGLSVDAGDGIQINNQGVSIKLATNSGLSADETNGLKIVPEQTFHKGMVMMFAGTAAEIPNGWAICDGQNGTPDLRDRFIVMAGTKYKGKGDGTTTTGNATVTGTVTVGETILTIDQIPAHRHDYTYRSYLSRNFDGNNWSSNYVYGMSNGKTEFTGGGRGHAHSATLTANSHSHTFSATPPYYALTFIMKK